MMSQWEGLVHIHIPLDQEWRGLAWYTFIYHWSGEGWPDTHSYTIGVERAGLCHGTHSVCGSRKVIYGTAPEIESNLTGGLSAIDSMCPNTEQWYTGAQERIRTGD